MHRQLAVAGVIATALVVGAAAVVSQQPAPRPAPASQAPAQNPKVVVYKSPTCGCCGAWVTYLRANGFTVEVHDQPDITAIKRASGVPEALESCHTAQVGGYIVEGHVPVEDIRRMLREHPQITGLSAPGMPAGAPGMGSGGGYDVMSFTRDGHSAVYQRH